VTVETLKADSGDRPLSLCQLIYDSRALTGAASGLQMSGILAEARPANARDGVTGVLTAVDGRFIQIIEGPPEAIDRLLVRLSKDRRHTDLAVRERRGATRRLFADWDMVSPRLAPLEMAALARLLTDPRRGIDDFARVLARAVAHQEAVLEGRRARPAPELGRVGPGPGLLSEDSGV
jgi:hypothetical protein